MNLHQLKAKVLAASLILLVLAIVVIAQQQNAGTGADGVSNAALSFQQTAGDSTLRLPAAAQYVFNGTTWDRARGTAAGGPNTNIVQWGSTNVVNGGVAGSVGVGGQAAVGAAAAGNPVYIATKDSAGNIRPLAANTSGNISLGVSTNAADGNSNAIGLFIPDNLGNTAYLQVWPQNFNGTTWDRVRTASLANYPASQTLTAVNSIGRSLTEKGARWSVVSTPAVSTQATASVAAEASVRHVADCISFSAGSTTAPALTKLNVNLRDGATGAGTIIKSFSVVIPAATGQNVAPFSICGLNLVGTTNTAMTLEFSALLTNLFEDVTLTGFNVN